MHIFSKHKNPESYAVHLEAVLNTVLDGIITIDRKGIIQSINPSVIRIFGYEEEELIGKNVKVLMPEPYKREHDTYLQNYLNGGEGKIIGIGREVEARRKDGHVFPMELAVSEMNIAGNRMFVGMVRDITSRKEAEEEIMRSNAELENFAYIASHDLQEPLRMVMNFTSMLESDCGDNLDEQGREYMHFIMDSARRMQNMINDLLEYSRVGQNNQELVKTDTHNQTQLAIANLQESIDKANAVIRLENLPVVYAHPTRFSRLMQNLIGNAIKYKRPDVPPEININAAELDNHWEFTVSDNGIGVNPAYLDQIFVIFKRLHSHKSFEGTGIGLSICKKTVEGFGGDIWATSAEGQGTTFHFTIPKKTNL